MLRACSLDFKGSQDDHLPLVEFDYNNGYHYSFGTTPYEVVYGRKCRSPLCWDKIGEKKILGPELVQHTKQSIEKIRKRLVTTQDTQKNYTDLERKEKAIDVGGKVLLKVSPQKGIVRFGKRSRMNPRYIGPFEITRKVRSASY